MRRREVIAGLGAASWPRAAGAQQQVLPVVGLLSSASPDRYSHYLQAFREGLGETGHVEGRNVAIEYRWADGNNDRLPALAADLVDRQVRAIAALEAARLPHWPRKRRQLLFRSYFRSGATRS